MILRLLEDEGKCRAVMQENGMETAYDVDFQVCINPVCTCGVVDMALTPVVVGPEADQSVPSRFVSIDVVGKKLSDEGAAEKSGLEREFAKSLFKQLDQEDFQLLLARYLAVKKHRSETASPSEIDAFFEFDKIEEDGLLTAFNDILPYAHQFLVNLNGEECVVLDQYCLRNGCSCTDALLDIFVIDQNKAMGVKEIGCYFVNYRKKKWWVEDSQRAKKWLVNLKRAQEAIEQQVPSIYSLMKERHARLTEIYNHCRLKHGGSEDRPAREAKVGRNDPCPCGSGKKYKKCCLGK